MEGYLYSLPTELLLEIFKYLKFNDLLNLRLICHRFNTVIVNSLHLFVKGDLLVTNQLAPEMAARSLLQLNIIEKMGVLKNWMFRHHKTYYLNVENIPAHPCLSLEKDYVWTSSKNSVKCFERKVGGPDQCVRSLTAGSGEREVYKFVSKQNCVISGLGDGSLWIWCPKLEDRVLHYEKCHSMAITAVDLEGAVFATGSKNGYCSLLLLDLENPPTQLVDVYYNVMKDAVLCTKFSPSGQQLFVGTAGRNCSALNIFDVERKYKLSSMDASKDIPGILDIKFESPNVFWTCDYNGLRRWDLRTNYCTQCWRSCKVQCFDYDNYCSAITGDIYGGILLWDVRINKAVKKIHNTVYANCLNNFSDMYPIYSLAFDATYLYRATSHGYIVHDYTL